MSLLISPNEVIDIAFGGMSQIDHRAVSDYDIKFCQLKFVAPVLGRLYPVLEKGEYPELVNEYIKPTLAYYVKYEILPGLSIKAGQGGVSKNYNTSSDAASATEVSALRKGAKETADLLLDKAVSFVEENTDIFPEYDPDYNIRKRISLNGGVIL